ncbi:MAG: penicillin-binding protein activator LpoB [Pseudomonadota bacterium]
MQYKLLFLLSASILFLSACTSTMEVNDTKGRATVYEDTSRVGKVAGVGIESQDVTSMTDKMMRDMLTNPLLVRQNKAPRVIIDSEYFYNESSSRINKNMITDRLRVNLNRAANGKMVFVGRHYSNMVEKERQLKRTGITDAGTIRKTRATAGGDYRLGGRITSQDAISPKSGMVSRFTQITFEMIDLEYGTIIWSGIYDYKKSAKDDILYR